MDYNLPAPLSMEFSRQEYWSGLPFPYPQDLLNLETKPRSPALQANSLPSEPSGKPKDLPHSALGTECLFNSSVVRTGHGTTDWFQIGKRVRQDCILSERLHS